MKLLQRIWQKCWGQNYSGFVVLLLVVLAPIGVRALQVTEIMYDAPGTDAGAEWIEVYNDSATDIPLTTYKLFEGNSNHGIAAVSGDGVLSVGEYAIIGDQGASSVSGFSYNGDVFDSVFSLNNAGEAFSIKNASGDVVAQVNYTGGTIAAGDGNSLHWVGGQWELRIPNPGASPDSAITPTTTTTNQSGTGSGGTSAVANTTTSGSSTTDIKSSIANSPVYTMSIESDPEIPVAGSPTRYYIHVIRDYKGEKLEYTQGIVKFISGDGRVFVFDTTEPFKIMYRYPGTVRIDAQYYHSTLTEKPLARVVRNIDIISPTISIEKDSGTVVLVNTSDFDIDVSGFVISNGSEKYSIAEGTFLLGNTRLYLGGGAEIAKTGRSIVLRDPLGRKVSERVAINRVQNLNEPTEIYALPESKSTVYSSEYSSRSNDGTEDLIERSVEPMSVIDPVVSVVSYTSTPSEVLDNVGTNGPNVPNTHRIVGYVLPILIVVLFLVIRKLAGIYFDTRNVHESDMTNVVISNNTTLPSPIRFLEPKRDTIPDSIDEYSIIEYTPR